MSPQDYNPPRDPRPMPSSYAPGSAGQVYPPNSCNEVATRAIPVPMLLSRIDDNQGELGDAIHRLSLRLDAVLTPTPAAEGVGSAGACPKVLQSALSDRLADHSTSLSMLTRRLNGLIERLEI